MFNMSNKTFEQIDEEINKASTVLAKQILALHDNDFGLLTIEKTNGMFIPEFNKVKLEIDVLPILLYQKQYGFQKTKALLKPWIANLYALSSNNLEALGFIRDDFGRCYLFSFKKTELSVVNKISMLKTDNNISLFVPSVAKVKQP